MLDGSPGTDPRLAIRPAGIKGRGVYATEPIRQGDSVLPIGGWLLPGDQLTDDLVALQVGPDLWLCSAGGNLDDYVNHSCEPNLGFTRGDPILYALRDIAVGEEVTWDYSTSLSEAGWSMACSCGAPGCRGTIRAWGELSVAERERLRPTALTYVREMEMDETT